MGDNTVDLRNKVKYMSVPKKEYQKMTSTASNKSPVLKDCLMAFLIGGFICLLGQLLIDFYGMLGIESEIARTVSTVTLVFLSAVFTAVGLYDDIAKVAGAGTLVPITGFANSVVSPAIEFKSEGFVLGMGAKMFVISGPVIVFGTVASVIYGIILYLIKLF